MFVLLSQILVTLPSAYSRVAFQNSLASGSVQSAKLPKAQTHKVLLL